MTYNSRNVVHSTEEGYTKRDFGEDWESKYQKRIRELFENTMN